MQSHILTVIYLIPIIAALTFCFLPEKNRRLCALLNNIFSFLMLFPVVFLFVRFGRMDTPSVIYSMSYLFGFPIYFLSLDPISLIYLLAAVIAGFALSFLNEPTFSKKDYILSFISKAGLFGLLLSSNLFLILFFSILLFLPFIFRGCKSAIAIYLGLATVFLPIFYIIIHFPSSSAVIRSFDLQYLATLVIPESFQAILYPIFFLFLLLLAGAIPYLEHYDSLFSASRSDLFSIALLPPISIFYMLKLGVPIFGELQLYGEPWVLFFSLVIVAYFLYMSFKQQELSSLFFYLQKLQILVILSAFLLPVSSPTLTATVLAIFSMILTMTVLFGALYLLYERVEWNYKSLPFAKFAVGTNAIFYMGGAALVGFPGFPYFISLLLFLFTFLKNDYFMPFLALLILIFLSAASILRQYLYSFNADSDNRNFKLKDLETSEMGVLILVLIVLLISGTVPNYLQTLIASSSDFISHFWW